MASNIKKRYKLRLNSIEKIEELLQELYNEADKQIVEVQNQLNKLTTSVDMNNEIADAKAKIAKAINDFINSKDKAIGRKLEIAKLMAEIHKYNGNVAAVVNEGMQKFDIETLKTMYAEGNFDDNNDVAEVETYTL